MGQWFIEVRVKEKKKPGEDLEKDKLNKRRRGWRHSKGRAIQMSERRSEMGKRLFLHGVGELFGPRASRDVGAGKIRKELAWKGNGPWKSTHR